MTTPTDSVPPLQLDPDAPPCRCGMVAVVGRTNVGKSTLVNGLLREKVSIVSPTVQTTRNVIRGVLTEERGQLVFLDTPGVHRSRGNLGKIMNSAARASIDGTDAVVLVLDRSEKPAEEDEGWMRRLAAVAQPCAMVLNKIDRQRNHAAEYRSLWDAARAAREASPAPEPAWLDVAAIDGRGSRALLDWLFEHVPMGPLLFPPELLTDFPRRIAIADTIREKLIPHLHDELPHAVGVWVEDLAERGNDWHVEARIYVQRVSQKGIVIGRKGRVVRQVESDAARELSETHGRTVTVRCNVKVTPGWDQNHWILRQMGHVD